MFENLFLPRGSKEREALTSVLLGCNLAVDPSIHQDLFWNEMIELHYPFHLGINPRPAKPAQISLRLFYRVDFDEI